MDKLLFYYSKRTGIATVLVRWYFLKDLPLNEYFSELKKQKETTIEKKISLGIKEGPLPKN